MSSVPEALDDLAIQQPDFNRPLDIHIGSDELEANEDDASSKSPSTVTRKSDSQSISLRSTWTDSSRPRRSSGYKTELETSPEEVLKPQSKFVEANAEKDKNPATKPDVRPASKQASHVVTRKRNSASKRDESAEVLNNMEMSTANSGLDSPPSERVEDDKIGGDDMEIIAPEARRPWPLPRLKTRNADSPARLTELESSLRAGESPPTEISDSRAATPSETGELSAGPLSTLPSRGRGRGGFRGRARGRGWTRGRGRGGRGRGAGRGGRGGRLQPIDREMSLSPSPVIKQLRDRQKELDKVFRRVASAQRTALTVIANRSESKLMKDPNAHMAVPEYDQVMNGLKARMRKRLEIIENEYNWRKKSADAMLEANKELINSNFHTDESGSERSVTSHRRSVRGFNSSFVRDPKGAALYDWAAYGWEEFIQRAKMENDISPQIKEIAQETTRSPVPVSDKISQLTEALTELCEQEEGRTVGGKPSTAMPVEPPTALSALADAAMGDIGQRLAQQPTYEPPLPGPQLAPFRNLPATIIPADYTEQYSPSLYLAR
ncbi:vegetative cell wall protein gp1 [Histoplasma capsulatum]|uniref:Vegetative cell wall protein gp1 n=1 Tax=Ajellomyces capsulatus TaxID=5037 RepID=A0A8A1MMP1_AJECA|nr:vegetative cell wall protein gp1 [Histoplasma capsulatum]